ncbi:MAG: hypothetical protein D3908_14935 [Candidatus Electrothrix sp. AUS4]|nr:hypothetical protein [Candidatus Electrothrix sp. AUS4]
MVDMAISGVVRVAIITEIDVAITTRGLSCNPAMIPLFFEKMVMLRAVMDTVTKAIVIPRGSSEARGPTKIRPMSDTEKILRKVPSSIPAVMVDNHAGDWGRVLWSSELISSSGTVDMFVLLMILQQMSVD